MTVDDPPPPLTGYVVASADSGDKKVSKRRFFHSIRSESSV